MIEVDVLSISDREPGSAQKPISQSMISRFDTNVNDLHLVLKGSLSAQRKARSFLMCCETSLLCDKNFRNYIAWLFVRAAIWVLRS